MSSDFSARLTAGLKTFGLTLPPESVARLQVYFDELVKWSKKVNLIARDTDPQQIIENHFIDSLTILPLLQGTDTRLLDIGSGAGFPGLVCKAARPELEATLVEPRHKRASFLGHIVRTLGLGGVTILTCRVEDELRLPSDTVFSHITGRAITEVGPFLRMVERFAPSGPRVLCMKGPRWREEVAADAEGIRKSPFVLEQVVDRVLPFSGAKRSLLVFTTQPIQNTPQVNE